VAEISFGWHINTWPDDAHTTAEQLRDHNEQSLRALAGAFDTVWVSDHVTPPHTWTPPTWPTFECWTTVAHLSGAFPSYRFGQFVMNNAFRQPAMLAKMAATLQVLTRGRLILGIGAGNSPGENQAYGYDYPSNAVRIGRLAECVQILRELWIEAPPITFCGEHYQVTDAYCEPRPDPVPPILIGGGGERFTVPVAARFADWWDPGARTPELYQQKVDVFRRVCDEIGRDPDAVVKSRSCGSIAVARTESEARKIAEASAYYQAMGPAMTTIGTPEMIANWFRRFRQVGCDHYMISRFADFPSTDGALLFAEEVAPLLAGT
jgi:alkanesulfonate monooxygenase SsuD/methylene tetrahydromethanopterin reductase-like flavin-dependent oxidoreductase (luciferase family)